MASRTHTVTRAIHWVSALIIIGLLASGIYMSDGNDYSWYDWHKSFGVLAFLLIAGRLYYRQQKPWQSFAQGSKHERMAKWVHNGLLVFCVLMPLSGMAYSGLGGHGVDLFGFSIVPSRYTNDSAVPFSQLGSDIGYAVHYIVGYLMSALVLLHIFAALKHHFVDRDSTLKRMLFGTAHS